MRTSFWAFTGVSRTTAVLTSYNLLSSAETPPSELMKKPEHIRICPNRILGTETSY